MSVSNLCKVPVRHTLGAVREVPVWVRALGAMAEWGRGPFALFLPATGPEQSALLRIYNIATALRGLGWRTLVVPPQLTLAQRRRLIATLGPDVLVMQGARHDLNRPALYPGIPIIYDMDDADFHLAHLATPVRRAMTEVRVVMAGSDYLAEWCRRAGAAAVEVVWTGTPISKAPRPPQADRPPVLAWAQSRPMTYIREAAMVRDVVGRLARRYPGLRLRLYDRKPGDDPRFADSFAAPGLTVEWRESCKYSDYLTSFDDVALGLAPLCPETPFSRGKSFGKVLAYLDRSVPVLASDTGEFAQFFTPGTGILAGTASGWVDPALQLLRDAPARQAMADRAGEDFRHRLSLEAAARSVECILSAVVAN